MIPVHSYDGRRVVVLGLGRTGIAAAAALEAGGARVSSWDDVEATRQRAAEAGLTLDDPATLNWDSIAALVLSPGIPLTHPEPHPVVKLAQASDVPVIGDVELFAMALAELPAAQRPKVIGITGTNGKSTTTALIGHILRETGRRTVVAGNIGEAILAPEPPRSGSYYVLELSSFQLDLTRSLQCDVSVFLNFSPDHLDRHGDLKGYFAAKKRLFDMQGPAGKAVIGVDDPQTAALLTQLRQSRREEQVVPISAGRVFARGVYALGDRVIDALDSASHPVVDLTRTPALPGRHNAQNAAAALAVVRLLGVTGRAASDAMRSFPGLPHRQERVAVIDDIPFINDSKATNGEASVQALTCYDRIYWIVGGRAEAKSLDPTLPALDRVAKAYLIGEAENVFAAVLDGKVPMERCGDLETAARHAARDAKADAGQYGRVVLFSPAAKSFDQFRDYEARGDAFREIAQSLTQVPEAVGE